MNYTSRKTILRANGLYLIVASIVGMSTMDVPGIFFGRGPESRIISAPYAGIGFLEAHGLALILGILLWKAAPLRSWHLTALAAEALLGSCNLVFWRIFAVTDSMAEGYAFTSFHWIFVVLQAIGAFTASSTVNDSVNTAINYISVESR